MELGAITIHFIAGNRDEDSGEMRRRLFVIVMFWKNGLLNYGTDFTDL